MSRVAVTPEAVELRRPRRGSGFSLEAPEGVRFLVRSRLLAE
jgi:uncharacterized protein (DUF779 family)